MAAILLMLAVLESMVASVFNPPCHLHHSTNAFARGIVNSVIKGKMHTMHGNTHRR